MSSNMDTNFSELLPEYIQGTLDMKTGEQIKTWLAESEDGKAEYEFLVNLMAQSKTEEIKVPESIRENFYSELNALKASHSKISAFEKFLNWFAQQQQAMRLVYGLIIFTAGIGFAELWRSSSQPQFDSQKLITEVEILKQQVLLSQLEHPSASKRLKGVRYGLNFEHLPDGVVSILEGAILSDNNQHVRIAAAQVMMRFIENNQIEQSFSQMVLHQDDAMVQLMMLSMLFDWDKRKGEVIAKQLQQTSKSKKVKNLINQMI